MQNDFSSLDKLVEFGLGMSIATQMMNTMNHTIANTAVPGVGINPGISGGCAAKPQVPEAGYYVVIDEKQAGPLSEDDLTVLARRGTLKGDTFMWRAGMPGWKLAGDIPEINKILLLNAPESL